MSFLSCGAVRDVLSDFLEGSMAAPDAAALARHLDGCAACASLHQRMAFVVEALAGMTEQPPAGLADRVLGRVPRVAVPARPAGAPALAPVPAATFPPAPAATFNRRTARMPWSELRRVAGWGLMMIGAGWQLGGGALAAQAMTHAAPVIAEARETVERTRHAGLAAEFERTTAGVAGLAHGFSAARRLVAPGDVGQHAQPAPSGDPSDSSRSER